jgi:hypothetical protein
MRDARRASRSGSRRPNVVRKKLMASRKLDGGGRRWRALVVGRCKVECFMFRCGWPPETAASARGLQRWSTRRSGHFSSQAHVGGGGYVSGALG